ncbi:MAG: metallophosphoesterase, partial [Deltaproteobacteria bacterium]|nr:metallophosphoesterase [Deltaproteobacteria bacterium]
MTKFQILHISDLHMQKYESFDQSVVLDSLIERVKQDRKNGINPEIVVVTGDIACSGQKAEYLDAKAFFDDLLDSLDLDNDRIFIVPGNHDVNRKKYRPTDVPVYKTMRALNDELENKEFRKDLFKGMNDYFSFIKKNYVHLRTVDNRLVPFANIFDAACGKKIGLVGLNSAWMCRKSPDEREIAIGEYQIKKAMQALSKEGNLDLRINVFHHPLTWLWPEDRKTARSYFNNSILMCGHLHDAEGGYLSDLDGSLYQFQAGGAYLGSDSDWPSRFQYITFNWEENLILLDFLKFVRGKRKWSIDGETGDDGKKFFELVKPGKRAAKPEIESPLERPETYFKWITDNYGHMDADKLYGKGDAFPLSLPEIFIPLYTNEPGKNAGKDPGLEERQRPVDVEALIAKNDHLLIEGHAGSGKTTLLKHLTYCLARKSNDGFQIKGMDDFLPVLILLKDLNDFFTRSEEKLSSGTNAEDILIWYFRSIMGGVLSIETLNKFLKAQKAVFLLDGLDELLPRYRDTIANAFADLRVKNKGSKVVFTGRPHGIEGAAVKRFGDKHIAILALNMEQVKEFIRKWFAYLYPGSSGIGSKNAESMIGEVKTHPAIEELIDNPLMLTAICILYHDGKELPGQRAELYKKFVDNLLYRRFDDSEMVHDYLKTLAFKMHSEGIRAVDRAFAVGELKGVYKRKPEETEENYKKRTNDTFEDIEPKCGLLKFESGQFNFWHLTFQEFLTARHIMDNSTDFGKAISAYWDNDWYAEVIELYIGYLSIENKKWANQIIEQALETADPAPFDRWRLSARTLLDIHRDRREETVQVLAKDRLLEIIDSVDTDPKYRVDAG